MSYIGVQPTAGQYRKLDDISASFNGSTTSFTTSVGGTNVTAGTAQQLLVSVGGVIQEPDADYTVSTNTITFTTAPASGLDFFAILMGDALNTVSASDGSITTAKLAGSLSVGLAAGTNSAPSLYFTGDSNTGVYSPGADQVAVATGGTARLTIDSSGNVNVDSNTLYVDAANNRVGIGTTGPSQALEVNGSIRLNNDLLYADATATRGRIYGDSTGLVVRADTGLALRFHADAGEKARIDTSGRLLVGTSSAVAAAVELLQIAGVAGNTASPGGIALTRASVNNTDDIGFINFSNRSAGAAHAQIKAICDGTPGANDYPGALVFSTTADGASSPTERVRITNTGETRITGGGTGTNQALFVQNSTPSRLLGVREDGYTQWGVATNSPYNFGVSSSTKAMFMDSSGGFGFNSSIRAAKTNIELAPSAGWIGNLNVVTFNYRLKNQAGDYSDDYSDEMRWGVIADDAEAVCPDFCSYDSEGKLDGFHYDRLVPVLLKALQESNKRIETLEAEVAALKGA